jgi:hypothetical protein
MDDAERMPPLGTVKPRQKSFDVIHRAQRVAPWNSGTSAARLVTTPRMVPCAAQGDQILRLGLTLLNHQTRIAPTTALTCFLILIMALALIVHFVPQ